MRRYLVPGIAAALLLAGCEKAPVISNHAPIDHVRAQLEKYAPVEIGADDSHLSDGDRQALVKLVQASRVMDEIFLRQVYHRNVAIREALRDMTTPEGEVLRDYFRINFGPFDRRDGDRPFIDTTHSKRVTTQLLENAATERDTAASGRGTHLEQRTLWQAAQAHLQCLLGCVHAVTPHRPTAVDDEHYFARLVSAVVIVGADSGRIGVNAHQHSRGRVDLPLFPARLARLARFHRVVGEGLHERMRAVGLRLRHDEDQILVQVHPLALMKRNTRHGWLVVVAQLHLDLSTGVGTQRHTASATGCARRGPRDSNTVAPGSHGMGW